MPVWSRRCMSGAGIDAASFGVSGQLFGIHRYRSESELGFTSDQTRRGSRKTQIAIAVIIASVAGLFVCLLIMDLTQSSETSEHLGGRRASLQSDHVKPINSSFDGLGLWQGDIHSPMESQTTSDPPASRLRVGELPAIGVDIPSLINQLEDNDHPQTTSTAMPTSISAVEEVTESVQILQQNANVDVTTPPSETIESKKIGLKSARSLPEERVRSWPGTYAPNKDTDSPQSGGRALEALPYTGQDAGLSQWSDMQKRSGMPMPAFDANKWLEALRAQYHMDKKAWPDSARNPRPFHPGTEAPQNQFLAVNNRGVVIPNSVQFPDVVKSAAYPQLQTYRYPQTSRNIQDILRYVSGTGNVNTNAVNRLRQSQWPTAVKKAAKVSGMYLAPSNNYVAARPEAAFLAATTASTPQGGKPFNGHAYISDPFHPYKPADPTEINHLADHNPAYMDGDLPNNYVYPIKSTKLSHLRGHFGGTKQAQPTPYTTAIFKPLGNPDQMATSTANIDNMMQYLPQQQKRGLPPLSVVLEIYPMSNEDSRTVPFRGTATSNIFRRPGNSMSVFQKEPSVRRPVALAVDASVASSQAVNVPVVATPLQFQPQLQPQLQLQLHPQPLPQPPAFGMTLAGLPPLPGMGPSDSKHRMVVHLNFYPKKSPVPVVPRLRDPAEDLQTALTGQADTASPGMFSDYPQRRQSAMNGMRKPGFGDNVSQAHGGKENYFPADSVVQAEFDASSLVSVLPKDVVQRFSDFLRAASSDPDHQTPYEMINDSGGDYGPEVTEDREDHRTDDDQEDPDDDDSDDEEEEDEEEGRIVPYPEELRRGNQRRQPPKMRSPETVRIPFHRLWRSGGNVSWSDVQYDDEDEDVAEDAEDEGTGEIEVPGVGDAMPKLKIMHGKTKVTTGGEKFSEMAKTSTSTTTDRPQVDEDDVYKPRRRLIIESSPKNHRMQ